MLLKIWKRKVNYFNIRSTMGKIKISTGNRKKGMEINLKKIM